MEKGQESQYYTDDEIAELAEKAAGKRTRKRYGEISIAAEALGAI